MEDLNVPFVDDFTEALKVSDHVVDAVFGSCFPPTCTAGLANGMLTVVAGFSFSGEVREPFPAVIEALQNTKVPVTSVDAPSSWDIENGPPKSGLGSTFHPQTLVSLTAPKPLAKHFRGRHFVGGRYGPFDAGHRIAGATLRARNRGTLGMSMTDLPCRFVPPSIAQKYDFGLPPYEGIDQVVEVDAKGQKL